MQISKNKVATIDYTLTNPEGQVLDSSKGAQPLSYLHGVGGIIPGLENALEGKSAGEQITVTIPPEQAYGVRNEQLVQSVPKKSFQGIATITPGMQFRAGAAGADADRHRHRRRWRQRQSRCKSSAGGCDAEV